MTAIAALVAEAIAFANEATSDRVRNHPRTTWLSGDVEGMTVLDPVRYHRDDVVDAALAHLVARVVGAEGRAERAEARAFWQMVCIAKARECIWRKMNARDAEGRGALHDEHDRLLAFAGVERGDWCAP